MSLSTSDLIGIAGILVSLFISIISIILTCANIKQNNRLMESSTRPYIAVFATIVSIHGSQLYIVLKNFGNTGATIDSFSTNCDISKYDYGSRSEQAPKDAKSPFENIEGMFFSPQQSIYLHINTTKALNDNIHTIEFKIIYSSNKKQYEENKTINLDSYNMVGKLRSEANSNIETYVKDISNSLQELVERKL